MAHEGRRREESEREKSNARKAVQDKTPVAPNRTIDESPAGAQHLTQRTELRDPIDAPGQNSPSGRNRSDLGADEMYGQTELPHRANSTGKNAIDLSENGAAQAKQSGPEKSRPGSHAYDPKSQPDGNGEAEWRELSHEVGHPSGAGSAPPKKKL